MTAPIHAVHGLLRARDYQDRPELVEVCRWWRESGTAVCALIGIGGAGKTALADRFARLLPQGIPDRGVEQDFSALRI